MTASDSDQITIEMPARVWSGTDGDMDNASQSAFEDGEEDLGFEGVAIREAGGAQVPSAGGQWPPDDQIVAITLSRAQWSYVLAESKSSTPKYERLGDQDSAELGRRAVAAI